MSVFNYVFGGSMSNIQFVLKIILCTFIIIAVGKILMSIAAYIGEQIGIRAFVDFLFRKMKKN